MGRKRKALAPGDRALAPAEWDHLDERRRWQNQNRRGQNQQIAKNRERAEMLADLEQHESQLRASADRTDGDGDAGAFFSGAAAPIRWDLALCGLGTGRVELLPVFYGAGRPSPHPLESPWDAADDPPVTE